MTALVTAGIAAFSNLTEPEVYQGQSTGRYSLVITLGEADASKLEDMGIKVRQYEGTSQRKFASKFHVPIVDADDRPFNGEIPYGSEVRVLWKAGEPHPVHGVSTYLNKVRVVTLAEGGDGENGEVPSDF
jgi:hypothetical protein